MEYKVFDISAAILARAHIVEKMLINVNSPLLFSVLVKVHKYLNNLFCSIVISEMNLIFPLNKTDNLDNWFQT